MPQYIAAPYKFSENPDGFTHPDYGGTLAVKFSAVTYLNISTLPASLFALPLGAVIVGWIVNITTAFNGTGTNLLDIGISGTTQKYAAALNVGASGQITYGFVASQLFTTALAETADVQAIYTDGNSNSSAGALTVAVLYMTRSVTGVG